jgi:hypothetical protein
MSDARSSFSNFGSVVDILRRVQAYSRLGAPAILRPLPLAGPQWQRLM